MRLPTLRPVSIHGPPEGRPKLLRPLTSGATWLFQSTAHPKAGRNGWSGRSRPPRLVSIHGPPEGRPKHARGRNSRHGRPGFNPRPTRRQAETRRPPGAAAVPHRFNPRPTRRQAETSLFPAGPSWLDAFQSTAHPKAGRNISRSDPVARRAMFQSTAHPKAGRNFSSLRAAAAGSGFNPRPTRRQAETSGGTGGEFPGCVSIHGPPEGRPKLGDPDDPLDSASFNPRPTRRQAETPMSCAAPCSAFLFQSTAHPKAGRNGHAVVAVGYDDGFQSTAHPKAGRNPPRHAPTDPLPPVSIHGPPEGRPKRAIALIGSFR